MSSAAQTQFDVRYQSSGLFRMIDFNLNANVATYIQVLFDFKTNLDKN